MARLCGIQGTAWVENPAPAGRGIPRACGGGHVDHADTPDYQEKYLEPVIPLGALCWEN